MVQIFPCARRCAQRCLFIDEIQMLSKRIMIRIIFLYVFMMSLCACSEQRSSNREGEFRLFDGESTQLFLMPKGLKVEQNMQSLLFFRVQYPTMSARDPQGVPQGDEI